MKEGLHLEEGYNDKTQSYWIHSTASTDYPQLKDDIDVDVAIIGGGMVGITSAYLLKKQGLKVAVLESDRILHGTTGHTSAKITSQHSLIYDKLKKQVGEEKSRQYAAANETAIQTISDIIEENNIQCDFEYKSAYVYTELEKNIGKFENEVKAASNLGIKASLVDSLLLPFPVKAAVRFDGQAQFHPQKYLLSLADQIPGNGSHIFENTRVTGYNEETRVEVITERGSKVKADKVIVASHFPCFDKSGFYFARIYQMRSYIVAARVKEKFPQGMFISYEKPTRSLRSVRTDEGELVLFIGDNHKAGQGENTVNHYDSLKSFAREFYTVEDFVYEWSTQDCMTLDNIPYVGNLTSGKPDIYVATGFGKWGMTNSTAASLIIRDMIIKGDSEWAPVYNPSRINPIASAKNFIVQNLNVAEKFISGKVQPLSNDIDIEVESGTAVEVEGRRIGIYRESEDKLHLVDTTCTHMLCELSWNEAEKSWDCPCHGSRFTYKGEIIEGPALKPLQYDEVKLYE